ncbi:Sua5/YciO/YrdC/YwlC family protein, partial [Providencia rettgeri]
VGFRVPAYAATLGIIGKSGILIGPSANISGTASGQIFKEIQAEFQENLLGIEDDAALTGLDSTILDVSGKKARILRQGTITKEMLLEKVPE